MTRSGPDRYEGSFHRRTTLRFCGAHGSSGACAEAFRRKVEEMYLGVRHGLEVPLPVAGAAPRRKRLDGYGWAVSFD